MEEGTARSLILLSLLLLALSLPACADIIYVTPTGPGPDGNIRDTALGTIQPDYHTIGIFAAQTSARIDGFAIHGRGADTGTRYFTIDDGSGVGVKVMRPTGVEVPNAGDMVLVAGVSTLDIDKNRNRTRAVYMRKGSDIQACGK